MVPKSMIDEHLNTVAFALPHLGNRNSYTHVHTFISIVTQTHTGVLPGAHTHMHTVILAS